LEGDKDEDLSFIIDSSMAIAGEDEGEDEGDNQSAVWHTANPSKLGITQLYQVSYSSPFSSSPDI
jgi:hypothetical protein